MATPFIDLSSLNGRNGFTIQSATPTEQLGFAVTGPANLNGDRFNDLVFLSSDMPFFSNNAPIWVKAYVIYGRSHFSQTFNTASLPTTNGFSRSEVVRFTFSSTPLGTIAVAGDVNGDRTDELILGMPRSERRGQAYILFNQGNELTLYGNSVLGRAVGGIGDINHDGLDDFAATSPTAIVFGQRDYPAEINVSSLNETSGFLVSDTQLGINNFNHFKRLGDFNGDGIDDSFIAYSFDYDPLAGTSYVIFGKSGSWDNPFDLATLNGTTGFKITIPVQSVSGIGDINGDGLNDLAIGSRRSVSSSNSASIPPKSLGSVDIVFGSRNPFPATTDLSSQQLSSSHIELGETEAVSVSGGGDMNGDKISDFIISTSSATYVVFGRSGRFPQFPSLDRLNGRNGFAIPNHQPSEHRQANAGDVNGDGYDDLILGDSGKVFVIFGGSRYGTPQANRLWGTAKADIIYGFGGRDRLSGLNGDDTLLGGKGNDKIEGGAGKDYLIGSSGNDLLTGNEGADWFLFETGKPFTRESIGVDTITDFVPQQDKIVLNRSTFTKLESRSRLFSSVDTIAQAKVSKAMITYVSSSGDLFYNPNGARPGFGLGGQFATLTSGLNLTARNVIVQA